MNRARLLARSWFDDVAAPTVTSAAAGFPVTNLQRRAIRKTWRSTSTAAQTITGDFGALRVCSGCFLAGLNLTSGATIQLELATDAGFTAIVHDETFAPWASRQVAAHWFDEVTARYARWTLTDAGNADGYLEAGRIKIGQAFVPAKNIAYGFELGVQELGDLEADRGGAWHAEDRSPARVVRWEWRTLAETEAQRLIELDRVTGSRDDVVCAVFPDEAGTDREQEGTFIGYLTRRPVVQFFGILAGGAYDYRSGPIEVGETL